MTRRLVGIAGFSRSRLTIARQYRRMTKKSLAEAVGLSSKAIANYEDGGHTPSDDNLQTISFVLGFPVAYFVADEIDEIDSTGVSFRSMRSLTSTQRERMLACGKLACGILSKTFEASFGFPEPDVPDLAGESPEVAAEIVRAHWKLGIGPISNMVHLLEAKGIEVYWVTEASRCLDAVSFWRDGKPFVALNTAKSAGDRSRLDAAHELGHLVLHRNVADLDSRATESEANRFAATFLMPRDQFRKECPSYPVFEPFFRLKPRWGVSLQAMVRYGYEIGQYSKWHYECACKEIARRGWRTQEPVEIAVAPETSRLHEIVFNRLAEKGIYIQDFARDVRLTPEILLELTPLASRLLVRQSEERMRPALIKPEFWTAPETDEPAEGYLWYR